MEFMWARKFKHLKLSMIYKWMGQRQETNNIPGRFSGITGWQ